MTAMKAIAKALHFLEKGEAMCRKTERHKVITKLANMESSWDPNFNTILSLISFICKIQFYGVVQYVAVSADLCLGGLWFRYGI